MTIGTRDITPDDIEVLQATADFTSALKKVAAQILGGKTPSPKVQYVKEQRITKANVAQLSKVCTF